MRFQESETTELKREYAESLRKDIIAFANTAGGTIYIGVDDQGDAVGVPSADATIQRVTNMVRDSILPDLTMFIHYAPVDADGVQIVRVDVSRGTARPYYAAAKGMRPEGVFVRQGTSAAPASAAAIRQMIKETDGDSYEAMRALDQALTFSYTASAFEKRHMKLEAPQMKTLGILSADDMYTNLGLLLSDQCPHIIKAAVFSGTDQTHFQDRREFTGSLLKQIDDAYAYLDMHNERAATFEGLYRIDTISYPEAALRETLLNAVVHRDYAYAAPTLISVYSDRIETTSVGGLMPGFTLADVLTGFSICRNPKLANVFYRLDLIEAYGTGLKKIMGAYPGRAPETLFQPTEHVFKVTLPSLNHQSGAPVDSAEATARILSLAAREGGVSRADVERLTGLSTASASRLLRGLVKKGLIESTGGGRSTRYRAAAR